MYWSLFFLSDVKRGSFWGASNRTTNASKSSWCFIKSSWRSIKAALYSIKAAWDSIEAPWDSTQATLYSTEASQRAGKKERGKRQTARDLFEGDLGVHGARNGSWGRGVGSCTHARRLPAWVRAYLGQVHLCGRGWRHRPQNHEGEECALSVALQVHPKNITSLMWHIIPIPNRRAEARTGSVTLAGYCSQQHKNIWINELTGIEQIVCFNKIHSFRGRRPWSSWVPQFLVAAGPQAWTNYTSGVNN